VGSLPLATVLDVAGPVVVGLAAAGLGIGWWLTPNPAETFRAYHVTANGRAMDGLYWAVQHAREARRHDEPARRRKSLGASCLALFTAGFVLALPIAAVALPELDRLKSHALTFGLGLVVWSVLLELATQPERNARYGASLATNPLTVTCRIAALAAIEVAIFYCVQLAGGEWFWAFLLGVSLTGMADVCAVLVTFGIGPFRAGLFRRI
jgi:hypothetical protein